MSDAFTINPRPEEAPASLEDRVAALEEVVRRQHGISAQQYDTIARQQQQLQVLQARLEAEKAASAPAGSVTTAPRQRPSRASRRRLLTTAGAAAAATAAVVALGRGEVAHAATGGNLVLGQSNDAGATTSLSPSASTFPGLVLGVTNVGTGNVAIQGSGTTSAYGVIGTSDTNVGVQGQSGSFVGVQGQTTSGTGVLGISATGRGGQFYGGQAPISLVKSGTAGAPASGAHGVGDIWLDTNAVLYLCTADGTPGTWVRLTSVLSTSGGGAITYLTKPIRLLDTRSGATDALNDPGSPYAGGSTHALTVAGMTYNTVTVPTGALGAIGNVTVVNPAGGGYLALVPHGAGFSGTAILAFSAGQVVSNSFNVGLASGQLDIIIGGNTTDVILDLFAVVA